MMFLAGLSARFVALPKWARTLIAGIGAALLLWGLWTLWLGNHDDAVIEAHDNAINVKVLQTDTTAKVDAAIQRGIDQAAIDNNERLRNVEINKGSVGAPSAASIRLNCQRLQRAGKDTSRIAACGGSTAETQAPTD